jgi:transcriptional regulator with XRE-family HTH domain
MSLPPAGVQPYIGLTVNTLSWVKTGYPLPGISEHMTPEQAGEVVRQRRVALDWSQDDLAREARVSQTTVDNVEHGRTRRSKFLPRIANALGIPLSEIDPEAGQAPTLIPAGELVGLDRIPVFGTAEGGEGAIVLSSDAVDTVKTPAPLSTVKGGYGVIITGESMVPAFWPGDIALVHPHMPPRVESDVILFAEQHGDVRAMIKNLVRETPRAWKLRQWNPAAEFEVGKHEWGRCHVVVGKYSRR